MISKDENLSLDFLAQGKFHKVWTAKEKKGLVLKFWLQNLNNRQIIKSMNETHEAYKSLKDRETKERDIKVAHLYNLDQVASDGFYAYEFISGNEPTFDDVKDVLMKMIIDPSFFIADFRPENIKMKDGDIVIIDPSIEDNDDDEKDLIIKLFINIKSWAMNSDKSINTERLNTIIKEFDGMDSSDQSKYLWQQIRIKLKTLI